MNMSTLMQYNWGSMMPEFIILITAVTISLIDLFTTKKSRTMLVWFALAGVGLATIFLFLQLDDGVVSILGETFRLDSFAKAFKLLMLIGTGFVLLLGLPSKDDLKDVKGEYYYLILTALLGGMMMASSADLITLFVGLELLSLSSYILVGIRKTNHFANEAAFKYLVNGGIATAITLFGMSYVYGLSGETNLYAIQSAMASDIVADNRFLIVFAFLMIFIGLLFKIAAAPFHMWAPDVYQGAETPVTAFLSVVSKTAGFAIILRLLMVPFVFAPGTGKVITPEGMSFESLLVSVRPYIAIIAILTIIIGNIIALRQLNAKRLFAYSSIAHAGYILIPFAALSEMVFEVVWFYLLAYLLMNLGAFAVIHAVTKEREDVTIASFAGMFRRSPFIAITMTIFLLSLAGIPFTAGFIGKFEIFMSALGTEPKRYFLTAAMLLGTVLSYVYYFGLFVQMYFRPSDKKPITISAGVTAVLTITATATLVIGIFPSTALTFIQEYFQFMEVFNQ